MNTWGSLMVQNGTVYNVKLMFSGLQVHNFQHLKSFYICAFAKWVKMNCYLKPNSVDSVKIQWNLHYSSLDYPDYLNSVCLPGKFVSWQALKRRLIISDNQDRIIFKNNFKTWSSVFQLNNIDLIVIITEMVKGPIEFSLCLSWTFIFLTWSKLVCWHCQQDWFGGICLFN